MSASEAGPAIRCTGLTKRFDDHEAVSNVTFDVPWGAVTGFVGANGSGKTTTMRMIMGLVRPTSGHALIEGRRYAELDEPRHTIGATLDRLGAHPGHSARQHLTSIATAAGIARERVDEVLDIVTLTADADRRVGTYSTGMRQRCALAVALLASPRILLLDEPSNGLDPNGIRWLRNLLRRAADDGAAVFVSTHQLADLEPIVDHLVVLDRGRLVAEAATGDLIAATRSAGLEDAVLSLLDRTTAPTGSTR